MNRFSIFGTVFILIMLACNNKQQNNKNTADEKPPAKAIAKPPSHFKDTLLINLPAAVFYHADSLQLDEIKALLEPGVFDATMHEYFYQMQNARMVISKNWPQVKIIEAKNTRFLYFTGKDTVLIDLNKINDTYGLFLFRPAAAPHFTDMMNIGSETGFYFKK